MNVNNYTFFFKKSLNFIEYNIKIVNLILIVLFSIAINFALFYSPEDYQQYDMVRMMYIHVPAAWLALLAYTIVFFCSILYLYYQNILISLLCFSLIKVGALFSFICLITGMIWGKAIWGSFWVWDARLSAMLILMMFYIASWIVYKSYNGAKITLIIGAVLGIAGGVSLPIIKFSVIWWTTLHQPASFFMRGLSTIDEQMLWPLFIMLTMYSLYMLLYIHVNLKKEIYNHKHKVLLEKITHT